MGASILSSHSHLIHSLLLRSVPSSFSSLFAKPPLTSAAAISTACFLHFRPNRSIFLTRQSPYRCRAFAHSASVSFSQSLPSTVSDPSVVDFSEGEEEDDEDDGEIGGGYDYEIEDGDGSDDERDVQMEVLELGETFDSRSQAGVASEMPSPALNKREVKLPSLTVKEKKELSSYAHSLGKKLKTQLVGKSGVTPGLGTSFIETLEANELLKIKILRNCPGELEDVVRQLEESTGSVVVSQIGRTIIIYRPSITKMKAEEKRREVRKIFVRKEPSRVKTILQNKAAPMISNRGRRGSSRG